MTTHDSTNRRGRSAARLDRRMGRWLASRAAGAGTDRGDVPGWVLVTLMTAGLVTALWFLAEPALENVFNQAISGVTGP